MTEFPADHALLNAARRLKFLAYPDGKERPGEVELVAKGWRILAAFGPMPDGLIYTLLGQADLTIEEQTAKVRALEAELAALRALARSTE